MMYYEIILINENSEHILYKGFAASRKAMEDIVIDFMPDDYQGYSIEKINIDLFNELDLKIINNEID